MEKTLSSGETFYAQEVILPQKNVPIHITQFTSTLRLTTLALGEKIRLMLQSFLWIAAAIKEFGERPLTLLLSMLKKEKSKYLEIIRANGKFKLSIG